jgi:trehalose 6-phosphate phosphatase
MGGHSGLTDARPILEQHSRHALAEYAAANVIVALDYDGTLSPITARPQDARMRPRTKTLLHALARRYPTVAISGRALADVSERLKAVPLWHVFGNHGIEGTPHQRETPHVREWLEILRRELPPELGIFIEDKGHSLSLHTRQARDRRRALAAIDRAVAQLSEVTVIGGKEVVNLLPPDRGNKGVALEFAMRAFVCSHAIYVGDDDTDEDAFRVSQSAPVLGIRVGQSENTAAQYYVETQEEVDDLLEALVQFRQPTLRARPDPGRGAEVRA